MKRGFEHNKSKLQELEKHIFDYMTSKLEKCTYGSEEYSQFLKEFKPSLDHHYNVNTHRPKHYEKVFNNITLLDVIEYFINWRSTSEQHEYDNFQRSIEINSKRFKIDSQLIAIFENTRKNLNL